MGRPWKGSRRGFVAMTGTAAAVLALGGRASARAASASAATPSRAPGADEVLSRLLAGNQRFVRGQLTHPRRRPGDFKPLAERQTPLAVVVGCADSRVAPEILFDQGVGDLFVVRVAGNVVSGAGGVVKGSIEYAVAELSVPLVLVLGHSQCGAVKAAVKHLDARDALPGAIRDLVEAIKPAVARVKGMPGDRLANAVRANVEAGVARLRTLEPILAPAVREARVKVAGGVYDLSTGTVTMLA